MKLSLKDRLIVSTTVLLALVAGGCTNSDPIGSSTGTVSVSAQAVGGAGRYDFGILEITQIALRPTSQDVQDALGGNVVVLLSFPIILDLNDPSIVTPSVGAPPSSETPLTEGTYEVFRLDILQFALDDSPPEMLGPTCPQKVSPLALAPNFVQRCNESTDVCEVFYDPPPLLVVDAQGSAELRIVVDVPGIVSVFENQFRCKETSTCFTNNVTTQPPCLDAWFPPPSALLEPVIAVTQQ